MDEFEDKGYQSQGDDFEVEYSDLPLDEDEERSVSGTLVLPGLHLFSRAYSSSGKFVERSSHVFFAIRTWLLAEAGSNNFADGSTKADIELEITDLQITSTNSQHFSRLLPTLAARLSLRMRLWRVVFAFVTIILALLLIFSSVPNARAWVYGMLAQPTPDASHSIFVSYQQTLQTHSIILINSGPSPLFISTPITISGHFPPPDVTPGPAPQGSACPARPLMRGSNTFGRTPVWVKGFDGMYATLHLSPRAVVAPELPNAYGWRTTLEVQVRAAYSNPISLYGENLNDGTSIFFDTVPSQGQNDIIMLNAPGAPTFTNLSVDGKLKIWNVSMFFSSAGCFYLEAVWPGGKWMVYFSAGR
jgi:hypothetical protein